MTERGEGVRLKMKTRSMTAAGLALFTVLNSDTIRRDPAKEYADNIIRECEDEAYAVASTSHDPVLSRYILLFLPCRGSVFTNAFIEILKNRGSTLLTDGGFKLPADEMTLSYKSRKDGTTRMTKKGMVVYIPKNEGSI